jgi:hypothetical protein
VRAVFFGIILVLGNLIYTPIISFEYIYDKFPQKNEICFWLQMSGETLKEGASHELKIKFYDENTGKYYESEKYKLQLTDGGEFTIAAVK